MKVISLILTCIALSITLNAQSNQEKARLKGKEAIKLMDSGKVDESIKLLEEAQKLDAKNIDFPYEIAYAYCLKKDYKQAIKILEKLTKHPDVKDQIYQMLGNSYSWNGDPKKAIQTYDAGLKKFPKSGCLHLERGNIELMDKNYNKALAYYEKGIEVEPEHSSNYYRAALLYLNSDEEVWGMIYGEIFINLEISSKRRSEISKLMYQTYENEIKFSGDSSMTVSFSKNATISIDEKNPAEFKLPFAMAAFEPTLLLSIINEKAVSLESLNKIRTNFVDLYYKSGHDKKYPNILFQFHKKLKDAGHFEAYNYWLLLDGNIEEFGSWYEANEAKLTAFAEWMEENRLILNDKNKFYRAQY